MFHIQPDDGHYQVPEHVDVLYVLNYIYIYIYIVIPRLTSDAANEFFG